MPTNARLPRSLATARACDSCKRRKVKCDASVPCANCHISQLACAYTIPQRKRGPTVRSTRGITEDSVTSPRTPTARTPNSISLEEVHSQSLNDVTAPIDNVTPWPVTTHEEQYATAEVSDSARPFHVIQDTLFASLSPAVPPLHVMDVVMHCIELYMQYTFAAAPLVHEPSLRASAALFFSEPPSIGRVTTSNNSQLVAALRGFALVTALCASVASMMPESLILYPCHALVKPFFHASREALRSIEDYDLEHPNSASLTTRVFHSTALQHMTGKHGAAWHVQGQAELIAQSLRLYNEQTIRRYDALEGQLLRMNFWHMYASDHVAAALRHRPCILHESLFDEEFTLQPYPQEDMPLMDPSRSGYDESFERQLQVGFHLFRRVATSAAKLVLGIRRYGSAEAENDKAGLARAYLEYTGLLDDLPHWLHNPNLEPSHAEGEAAMFHKKSFWVQRCTVVVTFHCLRLIILQQCIDSRLWDVVGLYDEPFALSVKKVEIIQDFLQTLDGIPFIYLQVKGEPTVERIRYVGSILLELAETAENETIKSRARGYSRRLLDILAKLNSKASDDLGSMEL